MTFVPICQCQVLSRHIIHTSWSIVPRYLVCRDVVSPLFPATYTWDWMFFSIALRYIKQRVHTGVIMIVNKAV